MCFKKILSKSAVERSSPSDILPQDAIGIVQGEFVNSIELDLYKLNIPFTKPPKVWIPGIPDTGSMDPGMDAEHNNILIAGDTVAQQQILRDWLEVQPAGNIVVYRIDESNKQMYAIHRIVKVERDKEGIKYTLKGDNNNKNDPYPVRSEHIQWLSIGVIY